jgi:hypothetical protein
MDRAMWKDEADMIDQHHEGGDAPQREQFVAETSGNRLPDGACSGKHAEIVN